MSFFSGVKQTLEIASTVAVLAAAGVLIWTLVGNNADGPAAQVTDVEGLSIEPEDIAHVQGDGEIAIVEFSDFQCPFCNRFAAETLPELKRSLIEPGNVRYVVFHFPLEGIHPLALGASDAAECAGQQAKYWEMHEHLLANSRALTAADLAAYAGELDLDKEAFESCLGGAGIERVRSHQALGARLGVQATPSFFLGAVREDGGIDLLKRINGFVPPDVFHTALDDILPEPVARS
jgi:protein-disulfide isomerase